MTGLPANAVGYRLAAIMPCEFCVDGDVAAADEDAPIMCHKCDGKGTRAVITDTEVEPGRPHFTVSTPGAIHELVATLNDDGAWRLELSWRRGMGWAIHVDHGDGHSGPHTYHDTGRDPIDLLQGAVVALERDDDVPA